MKLAYLAAAVFALAALLAPAGAAQDPGATPPATTAPATPPAHHANKNGPKAPRKRIVQEGGTTEPDTAISPATTAAEKERLQQITRDLVNKAEQDLHRLDERNLKADQKVTAAQIRSFLALSKSAGEASDWQRAHHLALKAQLLADDLVKQ